MWLLALWLCLICLKVVRVYLTSRNRRNTERKRPARAEQLPFLSSRHLAAQFGVDSKHVCPFLKPCFPRRHVLTSTAICLYTSVPAHRRDQPESISQLYSKLSLYPGSAPHLCGMWPRGSGTLIWMSSSYYQLCPSFRFH